MVYCLMEVSLAIRYWQFKKQESNRSTPHLETVKTPEEYPFVTVQLPIFNEMYVVERLIDAIAAFNYPKDRFEIQVLDDSTDETIEISRAKVAEYQAKGYQISLHHRTDRTGYKAGALQAATQSAKGEFIAIFDADFIPKSNFLLQTLYYFTDPKIGVVQTRWEHLNKNYSLLTKVQAFFLDAHFTIEQTGRNVSGYFINFNGTAGVWRKKTIEEAGGWQADTLTEDLDLSYRAQLKGWRFKYLEEIGSPSELPADMRAFKSQQFRWIKGGAETAKKLIPSIARAELPVSIKLNAFSHLLSSSVYIIIFMTLVLSVPLLLVKNMFIETEYIHYGSLFFVSNIAVAFVYYISTHYRESDRKNRFLYFMYMLPLFLIITMGLSLHNALAALRGYWGEQTPFIRTPKFNLLNNKDNWKNKKYTHKKIDWMTMLEGLVALYFLSAIFYSIWIMDLTLTPIYLLAFLGFVSTFSYSIRHTKMSN